MRAHKRWGRLAVLEGAVMSRAVSLVILALCLALVGAGLVHGRGLWAPPDCVRLGLYTLRSGETLEFTLPPGDGELRLDTALELPWAADASAHSLFPYLLEVSWVAPGGEVIETREVGQRGQWDLMSDPKAPMTARRVTRLLGAPLAMTGGYLRVRAMSLPEEVSGALVRVAQRRVLGSSEAAQRALAPSRRELRHAEQALGVGAWEAIEARSRAGFFSWRWVAAPLRSARVPKRKVAFCAEPLETQALEELLGPGQAVAYTVQGPTTLVLRGGRASMEGLSVSLVSRWGARPVQARPIVDGGWRRLEVQVEEEGPHSVHIENLGGGSVRFEAALPDRWPFATFGQPELGQVFQGEGWGEGRLRAVAPERAPRRRTLLSEAHPHPAIYPLLPHGGAGGGSLRISARAALAGRDDRGPRRLLLRALGPGGALRWERALEWAPAPAPYERLSPEGGWVSEAKTWFVSGLAGVERLELSAPRPLLVGVSREGRPRGDTRLHPLERQGPLPVPSDKFPARLRFPGGALSRWWPLEPEGLEALREGGQRRQVEVNPRLELVGSDAPEALPAPAEYVVIEPEGEGLAPGLFLSEVAPEEAGGGAVRCLFSPSPGAQSFRVAPGEARVEGRLWVPKDQLGAPFAISLGEGAPRRGRVEQRPERLFWSGRFEGDTMRFEGPPGAALWLRAEVLSGGCERPHRSLQAFFVRPGESLRYTVEKRAASQRVSVSAFGAGEARVVAALDGGSPRLLDGAFEQRQRSRWELELAPRGGPLPEVRAQSEGARRLGPRVLWFTPMLPSGRHRLQVTNAGATSIYVRLAVEDGEARARAPGIRWISDDSLE